MGGLVSCWQWGRPPQQVKEKFLLKNTDPLHRACAAPQPQLCTSGGLPHCQQLSLPQHVSTTPLHSGASSFVTLRRRKSSGRQRCWQWGRPPKQVKENFLLKNTDPLLSSLLSLATWCRALRGRTRAARPGTATRRWSCEKRAGGRGSCHGVARGADKAHTIRQRGAICDARGGLERVLVRRDIECCSGKAWQACAQQRAYKDNVPCAVDSPSITHPGPRSSIAHRSASSRAEERGVHR